MKTTRALAYVLVASCLALAALPAGAEIRPGSVGTLRLPLERLGRYAQAMQGPEQTERFSRTLRVGRTGTLDLSNVSGNIVITGGSGEEISIEATKRARAYDANEAKRQLSSVTIDVTERADRVEVRTVYPHASTRVSVDYQVNVPAGTAVNVRSVSGDIRVSSVKGELRAETVSGDLRVEGIGQLSRVKSVSGDVEVAGASADGDVSASSISGNLSARNLKCRSLDASSVSGELQLADIVCDRAKIGTVSGTVEYSGPLAKNGRYELKSHSGDIRLAVLPSAGFELDASTFSGNVSSDVPITIQSQGERETGRGRRGSRQSLRGTYGDASALIVATTFSGNITIVKK